MASASSAGAGGGGPSTTGGRMPSTVVVSFIAETEPGSAPAWLGFENTTAHILTLQLGGADFWQLDASDPAPPQLAVSADVATDLRVGFHESKSPQAPCVFLTPDGFLGANALVGGEAYVARVSGADTEALTVELREAAPPASFSALRAHPIVAGFNNTLEVRHGGDEAPMTFELVENVPSYYRVLSDRIAVEHIRFVGPCGVAHEADVDVVLEGAFGFTATVSAEPVAGAVESVVLAEP